MSLTNCKEGFTAFQNRFTKEFLGPLIPLGAEVKYMPIGKKDTARLHKFGNKRLPAVFIGYGQQAGGNWDGTLLIADWEEIVNAERASEIHVKRYKANEVNVMKVNDTFRFPLAEGIIKQPSPGSRRHWKPTQPLNWNDDDDEPDEAGAAPHAGGDSKSKSEENEAPHVPVQSGSSNDPIEPQDGREGERLLDTQCRCTSFVTTSSLVSVFMFLRTSTVQSL